jgi:hypothetical protein
MGEKGGISIGECYGVVCVRAGIGGADSERMRAQLQYMCCTGRSPVYVFLEGATERSVSVPVPYRRVVRVHGRSIE